MSAQEALRIRAELEHELTWRKNEIRALRNSATATTAQSNFYQRALVVLLYAHLEGFVKFALAQYAESINRVSLRIADAKPQLSAACLAGEFKEYRTTQPVDKHDPTGSRARQVQRDADLVSRILEKSSQPLNLRVDDVAATDFNLSSAILRRNLAMLALDETEFFRYLSAIEGILKMRNAIAHGENPRLPSDPTLSKFEDRIFDTCETIMRIIYDAIRDQAFRR